MKLSTSGLRFIAVGLSAAVVHLISYWLLTRSSHWLPLTANALAFCLAFGVSFVGHSLLSFADHTQTLWLSLRRFGVTALLGLATNEIVLVVVWQGLGWSDYLGVLFGQIVAAGQTFVLSRWWAFAK